MPPPSTTPKATTAAQSGAAKKRTPALEARKADRLRSQLLSMMPDPVDDPLFDAGAQGGLFFVLGREGEERWREKEREGREGREGKTLSFSFLFPFSFLSSFFRFPGG